MIQYLIALLMITQVGSAEAPEACSIDAPKKKAVLEEQHARYLKPVDRKTDGDHFTESVSLKDGISIVVSQSNCGSEKSIEFRNVTDKTPVSKRSHYFSEVARLLNEKLGPGGNAIDGETAKTFSLMAPEIDKKIKKPQAAQPLEVYGTCQREKCDAKFTDTKQSATCQLVVARTSASKVNLLVTVQNMEQALRKLNETF